jgi:hypothetical protein
MRKHKQKTASCQKIRYICKKSITVKKRYYGTLCILPTTTTCKTKQNLQQQQHLVAAKNSWSSKLKPKSQDGGSQAF